MYVIGVICVINVIGFQEKKIVHVISVIYVINVFEN